MPEAVGRYARRENWLARTTIRRGASLGAGAVVLPGLTIGRFAAVAAGAIVTHDVPDYRQVLGQPARQVGWVCACGIPLTGDLACPQCLLRYVTKGDSIEVAA